MRCDAICGFVLTCVLHQVLLITVSLSGQDLLDVRGDRNLVVMCNQNIFVCQLFALCLVQL